LKPSFGLGVLVVVLLSAAAALFGVLSVQASLSMLLLLTGLWSIVSAFILVGPKDRAFYAGWGIIIAGLSLSYFIPIQDALGVILVAIVGLIVVYAYLARTPKAPSPPPAPAGPS
jgi:hypothetical protein